MTQSKDKSSDATIAEQRAITKCRDLFASNPEHFYAWAKTIAKRIEEYQKEYDRLNPKEKLSHCVKRKVRKDGFSTELSTWFPDKNCRFPEEKEPAIVNPILAMMPTQGFISGRDKVEYPILSKEDALLTAYTVVITLYDSQANLKQITKDVWPEGTLQVAFNCFHPVYGDKTSYIDEAIRFVEADLEDIEQHINDLSYRAVNLAKRTITIGENTHSITSEKVWDFIKDLWSASKIDRVVPSLEGVANNKNAYDSLRRSIGKENLHKFVISVSGGYKLHHEVKILLGGQMGIRKTKSRS